MITRAQISIRPSAEGYVRLEITDATSRTRVLSTDLPADMFVKRMAGLMDSETVECRWRTDRIGWVRVVSSFIVKDARDAERRRVAILDTVGGEWSFDASDLRNYHRSTMSGWRVLFTGFLPPDTCAEAVLERLSEMVAVRR